jgi:glycine/D-amino acid oxidase-like deaminating enzyme
MEDVGYDDSTSEEGRAVLADVAVELLPDMDQARIVEHWSGLRPMSPDTWPVLGIEPEMEGLFYASGYGRNGILFAPLAARAVVDLLMEGRSDVEWEPFGVDRFDRTPS